MSLLRSAARKLGIGKYRYWKGVDLEDEWRRAKRYIEYRETKPLSEYGYDTIPVQWTSWLRRTRREPPTIQELQEDYARQVRLQENIRRLEEQYQAEKVRLAAQAQDERERLAAPTPPARAGEARAGEGYSPEGLPAKHDGGVDRETARHGAEVARELGTGEGSAGTAESAQEAATRRRDEEHREAVQRREEFAKQNPAPLRGNPGDSHQPQGWSPSAPARRR
ncbi:hypothetical protein Rhopal_002365-T1 [Rhodotorula paludigena]|uniref:NADH dehydrogenase [ubiquinone] 1 alpha subcomplex subunit n=1 Tax=Rhodotorula paludigena TaxID=86838 RepID=A0AAV5GIS4_9BASI|nr:hypothetical protein Rhopal_002365-T1 [Rhodotorula paludigena]